MDKAKAKVLSAVIQCMFFKNLAGIVYSGE
jgi:hypothetical protein